MLTLYSRVVSLVSSGRHDFERAVFRCPDCGGEQVQGFETFITMNAWPASPSEEDLYTVIDISVLKRFRSMRSHAAPATLQSFLRMLQDESHEWGGAV